MEKAANIVKDIAENAQADIGLDYAWLDDVTYMDWRVRCILIRDQCHTVTDSSK